MSLWEPGHLAALARHQRDVLEHVRTNGPALDTVVQPGGGGGGAAGVQRKHVIIVGTAYHRFIVRDLDESGVPTGEQYYVWVYSLPKLSNEMGRQPVAGLNPHLVAGDVLDIEYVRKWTGLQWIEDWWAEGIFMQFGCQ